MGRLIAGALLAALALACTSDEAPPAATATPPAVASVSPTSTSTRTAAPSPAPSSATPAAPGSSPVSVGATDDWEHRAVAQGDSLDAEHGILFVDAASGDGELWAVSGSSPSFGYSSSPGGRFVLARSRSEERLADRESGVTYRWGSTRQRLVGQPTDSGLLLIQSQRNECTFSLVEVDGTAVRTVSEFDLPPGDRTCGSTTARVSPDGARLFALVNGGRSIGPAHLFLVDTATGAVVDLGEAIGEFGALSVVAGGAELLTTAMSGGEPPAVIQLRRYSWSGDLLSEVALRTEHGVPFVGRVLVSPDGASVAWQEQLPLAIPLGAGGAEDWPVVVIADAETGETRFRVVRASLTNGTRTLAWLADGSAIVVATAEGFALLSAADGALDPLPFGRAAHSKPIPLPAPDDPSLFLFDGRAVDRWGDPTEATAPAARAWGPAWWIASRYGWGATAGELRFTRWAPLGRDFGPGGVSAFSLPAHVEYPPFPDSVRLRVVGTEALDVQHGPGSDSEVVTNVIVGAVVVVADAGVDSGIPGCDADDECPATSYRDRADEERWWLHVRTEDGKQGWARSELLEWAE